MSQSCEQVTECISTSHDASQERLRGSRQEEKETILLLEAETASTLPPRYVRRSWWERWEHYVDNEEADPPGPVEGSPDNDDDDDAVDDRKEIKSASWDYLIGKHGLAEEETEDVNPPTIHLRFCKKRCMLKHSPIKPPISLPFLRTAKVSEVFSKVLTRASLEISSWRGKYCLFDPISQRDFFMNEQRTLAELGIKDNTVFCLLPFNELGRKAGKVGLANIGNTCYMNSSLQCLLHTPELMHFFLSEEYRRDVSIENPDGCKGRLAEEFHTLMRHIWTSDTEHMSPYHFWSVLSQYYVIFAEKDQHDTAELAETVLDGLMEDCNLAKIPKTYITEMEEDPHMTDKDMAEQSWSYHKRRASSFITDKFHGQYKILTHCPECGFESRRFDSFTVLHLGLPPPKRSIIIFTLVEVCGDQLPKKYAVELDSNLLVKDLYIKAAELINCEDDEPWTQLCFVLDRQKKMTFLHLTDPVARIKDHHRVLLYSYRGSQYGPCSGGRKVCFVHQKLTPVASYPSSYCYQFSMRHEEKREFGYPFVMWLPAEDESVSIPKKRTMQDILEQTLRPFKRPHMDALHEEETKDHALYGEDVAQVDLNDMDCDGSDAGSKNAEAPSSQSIPLSDQSATHPEQDVDVGNISHIEEPDPIPDAVDGFDHHDFHDSVQREDDVGSTGRDVPEEVEMTELGHTNHTFQDQTLSPNREYTNQIYGNDQEEEPDGETDTLIGPLMGHSPVEDNWEPEHTCASAAFSGPVHVTAASSSSSSALRFGRASPSEAYSLSELHSFSRADEARTFVIDWDSNANQFYDLHSLECAEMDSTARGAEERRRNPVEHAWIRDCLQHEFSPHPCALDEDNMWKCGGCENMVYGVKSMRLWKAPDILLIGLKRFDYCEERDRLIKLKQLVKFPLKGLDLREFFTPQLGNDCIYDLYGVCNHLGDGPKIGHYTSCVKSPNGRWHKFNDTFVTEIDEDKVVSQDAYLLWYRKKDLPFPDEQQILDEFKTKEKARERREWEEYVRKVYESRSSTTDYMQAMSDDEALGSYHYGQNGRAENGSSSSNEMNNENDLANLSTHGQGSSSALTVSHYSAFQESVGLPLFDQGKSNGYVGTQHTVSENWDRENESDAVAHWQNGQDGREDESGCIDSSEHCQTGFLNSTGWNPDHETGTLEANGVVNYDRDMFESFQNHKSPA